MGAPLPLAIVDYRMGNLRSVEKGFATVGIGARLTADPREILAAPGIVLPGVGAFGDAAAALCAGGLRDTLREAAARGIPILGICLGMQLLFEYSTENGLSVGLGILPGGCRRLSGDLKVPHMGWNELEMVRPDPLLSGVAEGTFCYFVHSYHVLPEDPSVVLARTGYGGPVVAAVGKGPVYGIQFHPEKSSTRGLRILENFGRMMRA